MHSQPRTTPALVNRRPTSITDLELRVANTEKSNLQIINDIAALRQELHLNELADSPQKAGLNKNYDSDGSILQPSLQNKQRNPPVKQPATPDYEFSTSTEKTLQKLAGDIQTITSRCGSQALDIQNLYQELRNFDSKIENILRTDSRNSVRPPSTNRARASTSNYTSTGLDQMEAAIAQLEGKLKHMQNDRLKFENSFHTSLLDQSTKIGEVEKTTKSLTSEIKSMLKDNAQEIISLRQSVRSELDDISNQLNQRVANALDKMQDQLTVSRTDLEAALGRFSLANAAYETRLMEMEEGYKKLSKEFPAELEEIREGQRTHHKKLLDSLAQLDLAVEVLEQGLSEEKEQLKGVVAAEIKARTSNIQSMQSKLQELEERVKGNSSKINSALGEGQRRRSGSARNNSAATLNLANKLRHLEDEVSSLQVGGQRANQEMQNIIKNIAEAVQAVKVGLLAKMEKVEEETNDTIKELTTEIEAIKKALFATEPDSADNHDENSR